MKTSAILGSVLLVVFCALAIRLGLAFAVVPLQFKPNWLTIIPALGIFATFVGLIIRKELAAADSRTRKAKVELAAICSGTPVADLI